MFTGIITGVGRIVAIHAFHAISSLESSADTASSVFGKRLMINTPAGYLVDVGLGDSIHINIAARLLFDFYQDSLRFGVGNHS